MSSEKSAERRRWAAGAVHLFTGLGIVCALMATRAVLNGDWNQMFAWLGVALLIDGVDGSFARLVGVEEHLPRFSGERLDLVIDYVTYVFVPVLALQQAGFLNGWSGLILGALALLASLFHFSDTESKADDHSFVGFPAIWNIVAFYIFAFALAPWLAGTIVLACVILTFVPMHWVHPLRVERWLLPTIAMTLLWSVAALVVLVRGLPAEGWTAAALLLVAVYGIGLSIASRWRREAA